MDFLYLLRVLLKKKWLILGVALLASSVAWFLTMNQPKKYYSFMQFSTGFTVNDEVKVNNENVDIYAADVKFNNVFVTVTSPSVVSLLSYQLILHDLQSQTPFRRLTPQQLQSPLFKMTDPSVAVLIFQKKLESMSVLNSIQPDEKALLEYLSFYGYDYNSLLNELTVNRLQRTDYVEIGCMTENPELSAFIVNELFPQFLRYYKGVRSSKSAESVDTLRSLMDKKKQDLDAKNTQLRSVGVLDVGDENTSKLETIMNLETTLTQEQSQQTQRNYDLQKIKQRISKVGGAAIKNKTTNGNDELVILRKSVNEAFQVYIDSGSSNPSLRPKYEALKAEYQNKIAALTPDIDSGTAGTGIEESRDALLEKKNDLEVDIRAGGDNINAIQAKINSIKANLVKDASKDADIETLLKDAELANKEYLYAKQKYNDAIDITTSSVNNFRPVILGQPAISPQPSKRALIVGMAGSSTFIIAILILVLLTYLDSSIKTPVIFARTVGLKLISMINFMNLGKKNLSELINTRDDYPDANDNKRHNQFREALRKLRYEIERSGKQTFLFASTKKGEGKTTLIQALSYSMGMSKKRILIIDTNFCNNDLTVQLNADPILEKIHPNGSHGQSLVDQVKAAAKEIQTGIFAIGSEGGDYTPSEILPRENLLQHLDVLKTEYDFIFLEGPPLNDFSDSKELVQYVDGVIAIFSAHHIIKQIDRQSMTFFNELNGKFCGAVLNMVDLEDVNAT